MTKLDFLNRGTLFSELSNLARRNGVANQSTWNELVDEVMDSHLDIAELNADQDLEGIKEQLRGMWMEYEREAGEETQSAIDEDPETPRA